MKAMYEVVPTEQVVEQTGVASLWVVDHTVGMEVRANCVAREFKESAFIGCSHIDVDTRQQDSCTMWL